MSAIQSSHILRLRSVSKRPHARYIPRTSPQWRVIAQRQYADAPTETSTKSQSTLEETKEDASSKGEAFADYMKQAKKAMNSGRLSDNSIFNSLDVSTKTTPGGITESGPDNSVFPTYVDRRADTMSLAMDPDPVLRENWERSQIVQMVRNDWKISKQEHLRRTERECSVKSLALKTSRKKLGKISRQLVGKTVDEALLQLRFSKKRIADEVAKHLEYSRNVATAKWGMGLGKPEGRQGKPIKIQLKSGRWKMVTDKTEIYISQAYINREGMDPEPEFRARGRTNVLKKPWTSITFVLKEEATRVREFQEREKKIPTKKMWVHLPDRPITAQRQYPLW